MNQPFRVSNKIRFLYENAINVVLLKIPLYTKSSPPTLWHLSKYYKIQPTLRLSDQVEIRNKSTHQATHIYIQLLASIPAESTPLHPSFPPSLHCSLYAFEQVLPPCLCASVSLSG